MAQMSVYFPDALAEDARREQLNVSSLAQQAVRAELDTRGVKTKGTKMDSTSKEKIAYLRTQFDTVRQEFEEAVETDSLPDMKAKTILMNLQGIAQALEGARFASLGS
ncbi:hypothetical protein NJBCHELONAE_43070 [Mycobacteroides chelonae]|uniref:hypothetical protein n=1 Tax=Mycobacteroides chelonae TaxID=1774 RepID=UPI0021DECA9B|nr:hypothetical protein [Mycobacteroides chelonae]GLE58996.1 hypothetical protein NJBCHELONAE_43070 [Mycobacteroides chelonae]